ncbi:IS3 family transposase, partial [Chryseobacterium sp. RR2-3-20]|uniref:IS3 family transposase n=1 Tax=Chryseobacterium sp. RR2-3-20 TaxID=2787626 RepID=UPI001AE0DC00
MYSKEAHHMSSRRACQVFSLQTSVFYYRKRCKSKDDEIRAQLVLLAEEHETWGFWTMHHRLRNLGFRWNHKRVYRIYTSMKLNLRNKRKKRLP